jgi:Polyketide cyclase / dehydrase and lipid transport
VTTTSSTQCQLTGRLTVALPPDQAFHLFTPRGEQDWVPQWRPTFPIPADDATTPGTVFETHAHGQTITWVVVDRTWGRRIRYVRVIPHANAGTVTVTLDDADGQSDVTVTYELTALTDDANQHLQEFAERYPAFLQSWQDAIAASLHHSNDHRG